MSLERGVSSILRAQVGWEIRECAHTTDYWATADWNLGISSRDSASHWTLAEFQSLSSIIDDYIAPNLIGRNVFETEKIYDMMTRILSPIGSNSFSTRAISAVDLALWDLKGKILQQPVVSMIGGQVGSIRVYGSSMKRDITPKDEAVRFKTLQDEKGINAFKYRIGAECGNGNDEWEGRSEEIIKTINKELNPSTAKLADANSCYSPDQAIEIGKLLEDNDVTHFEEPCPYWKPEQTKMVTNALTLDVTGGEQDCDFRIWNDMIKRKIVNIYQPDIMYMGGLTRTLKLVNMINDKAILISNTQELSPLPF